MLKLLSQFFFAIPFIVVLAFGGCSSTDEINTDSAAGAFKLAQELEKDERYEEALMYYEEIKNKHPYSSQAVESKLRIADIHYKREAYIEAEAAYRVFKEFHPRHPKADYATFQLAMSYYRQLPSTIDRDLAQAKEAMLYFKEVQSSFPKSDYVGAAGDFYLKCKKKLAAKEEYIARFYFIRKIYDSALGRYEGLLQQYPGLGFDAKALMGASISALKTENIRKAKAYYAQLSNRFPKSTELKMAKKELGDAAR